jgi:predicted ribonuclease YlaK
MTLSCGLMEIFTPDYLIDKLHKENYLTIEELIQNGICLLEPIKEFNNQYVLLRGFTENKKSALTRINEAELVKICNTNDIPLCGLSPRDAKQSCLIDSLDNSNILLTVGVGPAGTGKTTLAVAYGLEQCFKKSKKLYMCKSTALVGKGKTFGAVPGDVSDKFAPHVASYKVILDKLLGKKAKSYLKMMEEKGDIKFIPVEYARGMTFEDCTFIIDEVQNLDWHELKTICSRMSHTANVILLGDLEQVDTKGSAEQSGIYKLLNSQNFAKSPITSMITLDQQYRGPIPTLMSDIDKELKKK